MPGPCTHSGGRTAHGPGNGAGHPGIGTGPGHGTSVWPGPDPEPCAFPGKLQSELRIAAQRRRGDARWRSALAAAFAPHMPCAPAPGGVAAEHRYIPGTPTS